VAALAYSCTSKVKQVFPYKSPKILRLLYPSLIWEIPSAENQVYLTFDDGPTPVVTDWVLDCLKRHNQKATFFCIGSNVVDHPSTYAKISEAGHTLGNHTMNHKNGFRTSTKTYLNEVQECSQHVDSQLFRPPYGRIKRSQINGLSQEYKIIEWSVISRDYYVNLNRRRSLAALKKSTKSGAIVVFHDSDKAFDNIKEILPQYLDYLDEKGFKSISL
jgi:peptidoglycan-N-acetylglucosamine deacetylase